MREQEYLSKLEGMYQKHFKVKRSVNMLNCNVDMYASCNMTFGRNFLSKDAIIDKYESNEHCMVKTYENADLNVAEEFAEMLKKGCRELVKPNRDHRNSYVTGVLLTRCSPGNDVIKFIENFKYSRAYKFYLQGWSDVRLIMVDLESCQVYCNRIAKDVKKIYKPV